MENGLAFSCKPQAKVIFIIPFFSLQLKAKS
jgi:hypothetical protein